MAHADQGKIDLSFVAGADLSVATNQYRFVKMSAANTVIVCAGVTDQPIGVLQNLPKLNQQASVRIFGVSKVNADAAIAVGNLIGTSVDGQAAPYTAADITKYNAGVALTAAAAAGELFEAVINLLTLNRFI